MTLKLAALEAALRYDGPLELELAGRALRLDLRHPHERRYALRALFGCPYPQADIDRALFAAFVRPGDLCLDLGANIGMTALELLEAGAGRVIAYEPVAALAARLAALAAPDLEVRARALSDRVGRAHIRLSQSHNQGHTLLDDQVARFPAVFGTDGGTAPEVETVATTTLDAEFPEGGAGQLWKIDVEGAEQALLRGAARVLRRAPPRVVLCECYDGAGALPGLLGPGWQTRRAFLTAGDHRLDLQPPDTPPDPARFAPTAPVYAFWRGEG